VTEREGLADLLSLLDRLERLVERSGLAELELEREGTTVVLRSSSALAPVGQSLALPPAQGPAEPGAAPATAEAPATAHAAHAITAPLTGVYYRSPSPGAEAYVREGGPVNAGQVIGLIEAMKLFNEIKSDVTGTVRRIVAGDGDLVKTRETLIEVDPA
jgi:acetyl-CoA carboxylase biotin carboxyl carrier protein